MTPAQDRTTSLWHDYSVGPGVFDELTEAQETVRPHWRKLIESLEHLGRNELQSRWENGRRIIREHGVTFNMYGDPAGIERPWGLDCVPLLITAEEWAQIEAGLKQRLRLFNRILADLYGGSQRLLRDGFLPPELVYANPGFLRPCRGVHPREQVYVQLLACDLARSPDGQWWVLSDRIQSPNGAGYAWENRNVIARILPEQMRECHVERLARFFQQQRDMLRHLAPSADRQPCIVLLTPGPQHQTYFEHAYLARHLGLPLVEGADLTIREQRVFLKTIEGLQPVDVLLRRVDDADCDPLELSGDSRVGVSGLVEAARAGNVTIANAIGAGLLETPALLAFLPGLCRHLLGEELLLPTVATWWCGQAKEMRYAREHLDSLVVKPAFAGGTAAPTIPTSAGRRRMADYRRQVSHLLEANPTQFVAQERVKLSRTPVFEEGRLVARSVVVRAFIATDGDASAAMPGGLARVSDKPEDLAISMRSGSSSKDTWVLFKEGASTHDTAQVSTESRLSEPVLAGIPSRAADHLFWLGRYTERLEQLLRVLACILGRASGEHGGEDSDERRSLTELAINLGLMPPGFQSDSGNGEMPSRMLQLLYEPGESGGVRELLQHIRASASAVRDRFSGGTWRVLGRLEADAQVRPGRLPLASATARIHNLVLDLAAFSGMEMENMTRGRGWRFLDFGRRLERGLSVVNLLRAALKVQTYPAATLEPVLEIADSVMTYRRQHFAEPQLPGVLALVLCDPSNPRSLAFQVELLSQHVTALAEALSPTPAVEQKPIEILREGLRSTDLGALAAQHAQGTSQALDQLLGDWAVELSTLSDAITNRYFSHTVPRFTG
jgi:uncharacterized circularly permuted ATP-grasp superfamily protein/uncharacterized alpha-E superfamily protein